MAKLKDVSIIDDIDNYYQVKLCVYSVNTAGKQPFLRYILCDNGFNNFEEIKEYYNTKLKDIFNKLNGYTVILNDGRFFEDRRISYQEIGFYNEANPKLKLKGSYNKSNF